MGLYQNNPIFSHLAPATALTLAALALTLFLVGCGDRADSESAHEFLLPWPVADSAEGEYRLQRVQVKGLEDPGRLRGSRAEILSQVQGFHSGRMSGRLAEPRLAQKDGLWVPKDDRSSMAVALYAHLDRLVRLDEVLTPSRHLRRPRQAAFELKVQGGRYNQAVYQPKIDAIYFSPYRMEGLSLAVNGGVIAHEHFHAHFNEFIIKPLLTQHRQENLPRLNSSGALALRTPADHNWALLRAWNEGLADFWAYIYGEGSPFLGQSLMGMSACRIGGPARGGQGLQVIIPGKVQPRFFHPREKLTQEPQTLITSCDLYSLGSRFTRLLQSLAELNAVQRPAAHGGQVLTHYQAMGALILEKLPQVYRSLGPSFAQAEWDPAELLVLFFQDEDLSRESCFLLNQALDWDPERREMLQEVCPSETLEVTD